jgi:hypothetical protein
MTLTQLTDPPRELAHRINDGLAVTLVWHPQHDELRVTVCDQRLGVSFQIWPEHHRALDAFYHPFSYAPPSDPPEMLAA